MNQNDATVQMLERDDGSPVAAVYVCDGETGKVARAELSPKRLMALCSHGYSVAQKALK